MALAKSSTDSRYSNDEIVSHDGTARRCNAVAKLGDLRGDIGEEQWAALVGRCRLTVSKPVLTVSKPVLKAPMASARDQL